MKKKRLFKHYCLIAGLVFGDLMAALAAFFLAYWLRIHSGFVAYYGYAPLKNYIHLYVYSVPFFLFFFYQACLYDRSNLFLGTGEYIQIAKASTFYTLSVIVVSFGMHAPPPARGWLMVLWVLAIMLISTERLGFRLFLKRRWKRGGRPDRYIIIGANEEAKALAQQLKSTGVVEVIGFLDEFSSRSEKVWEDKCVLGPPTQYPQICQREGANLVVLVPDAVSWETQREILGQAFSQTDVEVRIAPGFSELYLTSMKVNYKGNVPLLRFKPGYITGTDAVLKVGMDYIMGGLLLVVIGPLMSFFGLLLWLEGGRPVIQGNEVFGKNGRRFRTLKFRTGVNGSTSYRRFRSNGKMPIDAEKIRPFARFLYKTTLDKLPQLFNVAMGKMSLVGPRTIGVDSAKKNYGMWINGLLAVKPGMTGTWALEKSNNVKQEISITLHYVRNWNIWKDFFILGETIFEMLRTRFRTRPLESKQSKRKHSKRKHKEAAKKVKVAGSAGRLKI